MQKYNFFFNWPYVFFSLWQTARGLVACDHARKSVAVNYKKAIEWLTNVAEQGFVKAQMLLGDSYESGYLVEKDLKQAHKWHKLAAGNGDVDVQYILSRDYHSGFGVKRNKNKWKEWLDKAANKMDQKKLKSY